jgi:hypothetical protein
MQRRQLYFNSLIAIAVLIMPQVSISENAQALKSSTKHSTCYINVGYAHISTYFKQFKDHEIVKVNAFSKCDKIMEDVTLTVELKKKGFLKDHLVATEKAYFAGLNAINQKLWNKKTFRDCSNSRSTTYYGVAYAEGKIDGKSFRTVKTVSDLFRVLDCGT